MLLLYNIYSSQKFRLFLNHYKVENVNFGQKKTNFQSTYLKHDLFSQFLQIHIKMFIFYVFQSFILKKVKRRKGREQIKAKAWASGLCFLLPLDDLFDRIVARKSKQQFIKCKKKKYSLNKETFSLFQVKKELVISNANNLQCRFIIMKQKIKSVPENFCLGLSMPKSLQEHNEESTHSSLSDYLLGYLF